MNAPQTFVVGTGRCGSTLLSHIIRSHEDLLSVSELWSFTTDLGMRIERAFPPGEVGGSQFWGILATPQPRQSMLLAHDLQMEEVIYPLETGRFEADEVPPILQAMLPHLEGADPDVLFDEMAACVQTWGPAKVGVHYDRLFSMLARHLNKSQWVERSGGSLRVVERLMATFPEAKFVHLVRDGRDTALSMSRHIGFRMAILCGMQAEELGTDPYESNDRSDEGDLSDELAQTLPELFSRQAFAEFDLPPSFCGHYWSGEIVAGLEALAKLPHESLLTMRYEDLLDDPSTAVKQLGQFIDCEVSDDWVAKAAAMVRKTSPRWTELADAQLVDLHQACLPGFEALEQHGLAWSDQ